MTASITVTPTTAAPSQTVDVDGAGFDHKVKFNLTTVDANGGEVGMTTNINRPDRAGAFHVGINVPSTIGTCKVRAYQRNVKVAEATVTVKVAPPAPVVPGVPRSLTGVVGDTVVNLSWQAPTSDGGSPITGYNIYRNGTLALSVPGTTATMTSLTNGTTYAFTVAAKNAVGEGPKTAAVNLTPVAVIPPPSLKSVPVSAVIPLKQWLLDNSVDEIVVANGTYAVAGSGNQAPTSLWMDGAYVARTRPILVRAATPGAVTFDGGGGYFGGISFNDGVHHMTWDGFNFANGKTSSTGVIVFGGYAGKKAPHHITMRRTVIEASCLRVNVGSTTDHALYFSYAVDGWSDILFDDYTVKATDLMGLSTGVHMDHGYAEDAPNVAAHGVTIRNFKFQGNPSMVVQQPVILWKPPIHDWLFDGANIQNAGSFAIRFESIGASNIVFKDMVSTNSTGGGFYSSLGSNPPGVTFINDSLF